MRMWQHQRAIDDLRGARGLAERRADDAAVADLLLDEATVCDWNQDFAGAAGLVARAAPIVGSLASPALQARLRFGLGRSAWREERIAEAAAQLAGAAALAEEIGDRETRVTSLLVLGFTLSLLGRLDEAERRFDEVLGLCRAAGDLMHLGAAHANRTVLWMARRDYPRAVADLERARELARTVGVLQVERIASHNLAELLLWLGRYDEASAAAERSRELEGRVMANRTPVDALLVARIRCARGELDEARALLAWIDAAFTGEQVDPTQRPLLEMVRLVCRGGDAAAWEAVVEVAARVSLLDERLEIVAAAAGALLARGEPEGARALLAHAGADLAEPWRARIAALAAACASP